ncbi:MULTISPECIES: ankyrin repeat domain-containing protein [Shewanella]|jgi:hypothetical protein|uniref:Ankyrin repeat domain-containing protein n=2 Tax=Shewanella chilikensis TaxID=558541 RepID=A0A6G7LP90_9GAMM|nr:MULTISPECIES: ankyrin repeat domain-containing protein [Shewanella]MBZ4680699.1 hypothetical protein [Shewanella sp.]MCL1155865.1 ankyrin repeat domain-containing protein [Shewanella chilikensis]QIJ03591.1 ankyrin repeat domain-containing protein [Shewanella chilikensis]HCD14920.1 ankyrin repeat domain-containing protein [Shewanella sp.]
MMKLKKGHWLGLLIAGVLSACGVGGKQMDAEQFFKPEMVQLIKHIQQGREKEARAMIVEGLDLNMHGEEDITPLLWLITQNDKHAIKLALELGADPNFPQADGGNVITFVAGGKDIELLEILLAAGGDANSIDHNREPAVFQAIGESNIEAVRVLQKYGADLNAIDASEINSALHAAFINQWELVYFILNHGGDYRQYSNGGVDLAWIIHDIEQKKLFNANSDNYQWLLKVKAFLLEQGVRFPPPSPAEVQTRWAKEGRAGYQAFEN